jgi:hypothetical protein
MGMWTGYKYLSLYKPLILSPSRCTYLITRQPHTRITRPFLYNHTHASYRSPRSFITQLVFRNKNCHTKLMSHIYIERPLVFNTCPISKKQQLNNHHDRRVFRLQKETRIVTSNSRNLSTSMP